MSDSNSPTSHSSESQSLFQIYYLGESPVDRRCSSSVMPWIIEELKLKALEMKFIWLTPGSDGVSYVADNGQELFKHSYGGIVQCCIAVDGISFAYIARREKDNKYFCHVFQALTYEEAAQIMAKFKKHASEEMYVLGRRQSTSSPELKHHLMFQSKTNKNGNKKIQESNDTTLCEYNLEYLGKFEVTSPATSSDSQVQTIDNIVAKLKDSAKKMGGAKNKRNRRSFGAMFRKSTSSHTSLSSLDIGSTSEAVAVEDDGLHPVDSSTSLASVESSPDVTVKVTCASPTEVTNEKVVSVARQQSDEQVNNNSEVKGQDDSSREGTPAHNEEVQAKSVSVDSDLQNVGEINVAPSRTSSQPLPPHTSQLQEKPPTANETAKRIPSKSESSEFDTLPELASLQESPEFQHLSQKNLLKHQSGQRVRLLFSGLSVKVVLEESGEELFKRKIRTIACCAQGKKDGEYLGFTCKEGPRDAKTYYLHLFLSTSSKMAGKVLESFKSAFVHALSISMPAALCDSCPMQHLHDLCKRLEGVSTQVAQSKIQECLSSFSEADYSRVMQQYKSSEHADHEYTQIIILVSLLRQYYQKKQEHHTHQGSGDDVITGLEVGIGDKLRVPALARAKKAIANSIDNLRSRQPVKKSQTVDIDSETEKVVVEDRSAQSLNITTTRPTSPLFSKKANINTLMAPVALSPGKNDGGLLKRERSWSGGGFRLRKPKAGKNDGGVATAAAEQAKEDAQNGPGGEESLEKKEKGKVDDEKRNTIVSPLQQANGVALDSIRRTNTPPIPSPTLHKSAFKTPKKKPISKIRSLRSKDRTVRHSLTPPSTAPTSDHTPSFNRSHRRSKSLAASVSWRQEIFDSVSSPTKVEGRDRKSSSELLEEFEIIEPPPIDQVGMGYMSPKMRFEEEQQRSPRSRARKRWKNAIEQQVMLNRMEKENKLVLKASSEADMKQLKLCYSDPSLNVGSATVKWSKLLEQSDPKPQEVHEALLTGVPGGKRGEVWAFLIEQYKAREEIDFALPSEYAGTEGLEQLYLGTTEYEHNIVVDLGRTFPSHPYFSNSLNHSGQDSLRKVLHAYAVADRETGYCQGISFIAGMILMHTKDEEMAFNTFYHMMVLYDYRKIYFENLSNLQMRLYQFSRLLHDFSPALYQLLKENEVTPFFYAAPWFLTIFASQYPIAFTARVFDLFFYEGPDIVFKVALTLMKLHEDNLLECTSMESTCNYLKTAIPECVLDNMSVIFQEALQIDLGNKLQCFETEYEVMSELRAIFNCDFAAMTDIDAVNDVLKQQNMALIEQLAICHGSIRNLEGMVTTLKAQVDRQQERLEQLESGGGLRPIVERSPTPPNILLSSDNEQSEEVKEEAS